MGKHGKHSSHHKHRRAPSSPMIPVDEVMSRADLVALIKETVATAVKEAVPGPSTSSAPRKRRRVLSSSSSSSGSSSRSASDSDSGDTGPTRGRYLLRADLADLLLHFRETLGFAETDPVPASSTFRQFRKPKPPALPLLPDIKELLLSEWGSVDKGRFPRYFLKDYVLEDFDSAFPPVLKIDSLAVTLAGVSSVADDAAPPDAVDKKVESALRRVHSAALFAVRGCVYASYAAQSLLVDFDSLQESLQEGASVSETFGLVVQQAQFLSDLSYDLLRAVASVVGAAVAARRHLWMRTWKADQAQKAAILRLPFLGGSLFGPKLEESVKKASEDRKLAFGDKPSSWKKRKPSQSTVSGARGFSFPRGQRGRGRSGTRGRGRPVSEVPVSKS